MTDEISEREKQAQINQTKIINKLGKIGKLLLYGSISVVWIVVAILGIIDLWNGKGFLETPWIIFGLILTVLIIPLVIIPLFKNVKTEVKRVLEEKERNKENDN